MRICYLANVKGWHQTKWAEYFINKGYEVYFISGDTSRLSYIKEDLKGVKKIYYLPHRFIINPKISFLYNLIRLPLIVYQLKRFLKEIKPDILHAHEAQYGFWGALSGFHPLIFTPMGSDIIIQAQRYLLYKWIARITFRYVDMVTGDSLLLQESGFKIGAKRENNYIIQNGVDTKQFNPKVDRTRIRKELGLGDSPVILSVRSFQKIYNIDLIIRLAPKILASLPSVRFIFLYGFGDLEHELKNLALELRVSDSMYFIGNVPYSLMPYYMKAADLCISIPSSDSSPKSVYEAMACGTPTLLSNLPWTRDFIRDRENALLVPLDSEEAIVSGIIELLTNQELRDRIIKGGLELVEEYLDYYKNMEKMERLMLELIEKKG